FEQGVPQLLGTALGVTGARGRQVGAQVDQVLVAEAQLMPREAWHLGHGGHQSTAPKRRNCRTHSKSPACLPNASASSTVRCTASRAGERLAGAEGSAPTLYTQSHSLQGAPCRSSWSGPVRPWREKNVRHWRSAAGVSRVVSGSGWR